MGLEATPSLVLHRGRVAAAQDDVETVRERPLRLGSLQIEGRDHTLPGFGVAHRVEDRVLPEQRIARKVHLGDEPRGEGRPEEREVDVGRPPGVAVVAPWICAWLYGDEPVAALVVG